MSEILSKAEHERRGHFCSVLARPDTLPWFMAHIEHYAYILDERPTTFDVQIRMKWLLLEKGLAATDYLIKACETHRGEFTSPVRKYRLPNSEEVMEAFLEALKQVFEEHGVAELK
jgi:hypothetical protein